MSAQYYIKLNIGKMILRQSLQIVAEYVSKLTNTIINVCGIIGLMIGLAETQQLNFRDPNKKRIRFHYLKFFLPVRNHFRLNK